LYFQPFGQSDKSSASIFYQTMSATLAPADAARAAVKDYSIVLVTGGSGYIGSHTVLEVLKAGCAVVVIDNLVNSHMESLLRVYHIARAEYTRLGRDADEVPPLIFHATDLRDRRGVSRVFQCYQTSENMSNVPEVRFNATIIKPLSAKETYKMLDYSLEASKQAAPLVTEFSSNIENGKIHSVIHFAALKAVGESVSKPLQYYQNNIGGLLNLLDVMSTYNVNRMVFSSSAVVYGSGKEANISEDEVQVGGQGTGGGLVTNPYGRSKWMAEEILNDYTIAHPNFSVISLRYFNPTGSHPSGLIGEDPKGTPNNIVPVILQAYQRRRSKVYVFGSNYDTADGTGVRDYIHVLDLAGGHLAALRSLLPSSTQKPKERKFSIIPPSPENPDGVLSQPNYRVYNLGTGHGYSVLDILKAFASISGRDIPFAIGDARAGDLGTVTASTTKASTELGWHAEFDIQDMCRDVFTWASENPVGYERLRRLSTLALKDPGAMRKASVAVGLTSGTSDLSSIVESFASLATDSKSFDNMIRRLSTISDDLKDEIEHAAMPEGGSYAASNNNGPQWGLFGEGWQDKSLPIRSR
jgi:UDP-glucose 4-epimerase